MEDKLTTEEKLAQSTGNDTEKFGKQLEDEADELIRQAYGGDKADENDADGEDDDGEKGDKEGEAEGNGSDDQDADKDGSEDSEKVIDPEIKELLGKLDKSEKRIKDTRADHTRGRQELKDEKSRNSELEDTVFKLKTQMEALQNAQTAKQEVKTEKAVEKTSGALADQIAAMEKVDPEMASAMKPIVEGMFGQIDGLKDQLATEKENNANQKIQDENDRHFRKIDKAHDGWENTMQTPEFASFLQDLSPRAKRLAMLDLDNGSAENVIEVFDEFKASQKTEEDAGESKLEKAQRLSNPDNKKSKNIDTRTKKMLFTRTQINNMSDAEYAKNEDAIDAAMAGHQIQQI